MATTVNKEIWLPTIEETFYSEWGILTRLGRDDSVYADAKEIHIPQAGTKATLLKNNSSYPVGAGERADSVLTYSVDSYQITPTRIGRFDTKDITYDKQQSVAKDVVGQLGEYIKFDIFTSWYPGKVTGKFVETSGDPSALVKSEAPGSTADVRTITVDDVRSAAKILDKQKVPTTGRILLLPPSMFYQLHSALLDEGYSINDNDGLAMFSKPFLGFSVIMQPEVVNVTSTGTLRAYGNAGATTDLQVGLAYQKDQVSFAKSGDFWIDFVRGVGYFGETIEGEGWAGGSYRRADKLGIVPIIQKTV